MKSRLLLFICQHLTLWAKYKILSICCVTNVPEKKESTFQNHMDFFDENCRQFGFIIRFSFVRSRPTNFLLSFWFLYSIQCSISVFRIWISSVFSFCFDKFTWVFMRTRVWRWVVVVVVVADWIFVLFLHFD